MKNAIRILLVACFAVLGTGMTADAQKTKGTPEVKLPKAFQPNVEIRGENPVAGFTYLTIRTEGQPANLACFVFSDKGGTVYYIEGDKAFHRKLEFKGICEDSQTGAEWLCYVEPQVDGKTRWWGILNVKKDQLENIPIGYHVDRTAPRFFQMAHRAKGDAAP